MSADAGVTAAGPLVKRFPKLARLSQPWAFGHSFVRADLRYSEFYLRTLRLAGNGSRVLPCQLKGSLLSKF